MVIDYSKPSNKSRPTPDTCKFEIYPNDCTSREYFEEKGYLKNYAPNFKPLDELNFQDSLRKAKDLCKKWNCYGYLSRGDGKFTIFSNESVYVRKGFCKKDNNLVIQSGKGFDKYFTNNCEEDPFEKSTESKEFGWMPFVNYTSVDSRIQCSYDTPLKGYYSWNEKLKKCAILKGKVDNWTFCKLSGGSDFIAYSKKKEYEDKRCKEIGSSFILFRFLT